MKFEKNDKILNILFQNCDVIGVEIYFKSRMHSFKELFKNVSTSNQFIYFWLHLSNFIHIQLFLIISISICFSLSMSDCFFLALSLFIYIYIYIYIYIINKIKLFQIGDFVTF